MEHFLFAASHVEATNGSLIAQLECHPFPHAQTSMRRAAAHADVMQHQMLLGTLKCLMPQHIRPAATERTAMPHGHHAPRLLKGLEVVGARPVSINLGGVQLGGAPPSPSVTQREVKAGVHRAEGEHRRAVVRAVCIPDGPGKGRREGEGERGEGEGEERRGRGDEQAHNWNSQVRSL